MLLRLAVAVVWLFVLGSSTNNLRFKQYNMFHMRGVEYPSIVSNTSLSTAKKNQIALLSIDISSPTQSNGWFGGSVQNVPEFVSKSFKHKNENGAILCQLRLLGLGHYSSFFHRTLARPYEGGLATVRVKRMGPHATLRCHYVTGRNQHFVLVVRNEIHAPCSLCLSSSPLMLPST